MQYLAAVRSLERQFKGFTLQHVDRARNEEADALAKAAAKGEALPSDVFYHVIDTLAVRNPEGLQITQDAEGHRIVNLIMAEDWRTPITLYLQGHYHPSDSNEAKRLKHRSQDFTLVEGQLYKKGISQPMLKCITEIEGIQILREVHIGTCGSHSGPMALAAKVIRQGFYWPTIICTANQVTKSCEACRKFSPRSDSPSQFTKLIAHTWSLQRWGLDIVGPLPTAQGNLKFTFVVVEYFTKWIEDRAVSTITSKTAQNSSRKTLSAASESRPNSQSTTANSSIAKTLGISAFSSAPSLSSPQCTTHNPMASLSVPMARFLLPSRKDSSTIKRANGSTNYLKWYGP
jgi:hypothetical protein